jgi:hypothetical protein
MKKLFLTAILVVSISASAFTNLKTLVDCKLTIKDNQTGKSHTITVHGTSCADLIKSIIN